MRAAWAGGYVYVLEYFLRMGGPGGQRPSRPFRPRSEKFHSLRAHMYPLYPFTVRPFLSIESAGIVARKCAATQRLTARKARHEKLATQRLTSTQPPATTRRIQGIGHFGPLATWRFGCRHARRILGSLTLQGLACAPTTQCKRCTANAARPTAMGSCWSSPS